MGVGDDGLDMTATLLARDNIANSVLVELEYDKLYVTPPKAER